MSEEKIIDKIEAVSKLDKKGLLDSEMVERAAPNKERFDSLVKIDQSLPEEKSTQVSLMDEVRNLHSKVEQLHKVTPTELAEQSRGVIAQIEEIKYKLKQPNQTLKTSTVPLLESKINHMDESLRVALSKAGLEYKAPDKQGVSLAQPIDRFFEFLTNGQSQLETLSNDVMKMHLNGQTLSPASMLAVQVKVGFIQQELEFFSSLLNKGLESTKTIMNVQV